MLQLGPRDCYPSEPVTAEFRSEWFAQRHNVHGRRRSAGTRKEVEGCYRYFLKQREPLRTSRESSHEGLFLQLLLLVAFLIVSFAQLDRFCCDLYAGRILLKPTNGWALAGRSAEIRDSAWRNRPV